MKNIHATTMSLMMKMTITTGEKIAVAVSMMKMMRRTIITTEKNITITVILKTMMVTIILMMIITVRAEIHQDAITLPHQV